MYKWLKKPLSKKKKNQPLKLIKNLLTKKELKRNIDKSMDKKFF